jgi:hypothetical protein
MVIRRGQEEIRSLLEGYRQRGVTRAEFCRQQGIATSTLDYYVRRYGSPKVGRFARVKITAQAREAVSAR